MQSKQLVGTKEGIAMRQKKREKKQEKKKTKKQDVIFRSKLKHWFN